MATGRKTGGRIAGTSNKATMGLKAAFQKHEAELVKEVLALTKDKDPRVRLGACQAAMDRGWGKASQTMNATVDISLAALMERIDGRSRGIDHGCG